MKLARILKRTAAAVIAGVMIAGMSGCAAGKKKNDGKLSIVCTGFSGYDWTREILGDHLDEMSVRYLMDSGADLHSYQPSADDIVEIASCDIFICVGGESEQWVDDAVAEAKNKDMKVIYLLDPDVIGTKEEEIKEGMEAEGEEEEEEEGEPEYDEHVWLSVRNASALCGEICDALCEKDPDNAEDYRANLSAYQAKLGELDEAYKTAVAEGTHKTLVICDRFPFRYLFDDYGIDYYAAFAGCSAETEASFSTVTFLAQKTDELGLSHVLVIEGSDGRIAQSVIDSSKTKNASVLELDSLQSVTADRIKSGTTYLSVMENNLNILKEAMK
ncbi:MAG: zinc ABC transporter substrate-binding protein [Ruminococcus sp.]|nr:zinc ABC transporter substrate-binding protein [Ruminococcus sp.]